MGPREVVSATIEPAIQVVPLDAIDFQDTTFRVRVHVDHAELIPSLREHGQLAPVTLRATACARGGLQIVCGFRRLLAMRELGISPVQARSHGALPDEDALRLAIADNSHPGTMTDLDRGHAIALLRERHGHTLASAAAAMSPRARHTRRLEKLTEFPATLRSAIAAGRFEVSAKPRYLHAVHEQLDVSDAPVALSNLTLLHHGYADPSAVRRTTLRADSSARNRDHDRSRIISARRTTLHEEALYHDHR